jgi:phenylalanyl-tRNA synthetase beta chain
MIPTLLSFVKNNKGYADSFGIFEIGHTVEGLREADGYCNEKKKLGAVLYSKTESEELLFSKVVDMANELCENLLKVTPTFRECEGAYGFEHPANCYAIYAGGKKIGFVSVPHPTVNAAIDKKCAAAFLEITTADFAEVEKQKTAYNVPSKFPDIDIDVTFVTKLSEVKFDEVCASAFAAAPTLLTDVKAKDAWESDDGSCALTLRFTFSSSERTLTKQELSAVVADVAVALAPHGLTVKD